MCGAMQVVIKSVVDLSKWQLVQSLNQLLSVTYIFRLLFSVTNPCFLVVLIGLLGFFIICIENIFLCTHMLCQFQLNAYLIRIVIVTLLYYTAPAIILHLNVIFTHSIWILTTCYYITIEFCIYSFNLNVNNLLYLNINELFNCHFHSII